MSKSNTRITADIPTVDHKKLKLLAAYYNKSMREFLIEFIEQDLEYYKECLEDHTPNTTTKKALEKVKTKKGLQKTNTVEELFKKLSQ